MALPIDPARPFRYPSELQDLARAVQQADANDESTWIEWKQRLDLQEKVAHYHIAKHILGFANRPVASAHRYSGGHAYLLIGVEPGVLSGVESVDQADLGPWIIRYVGFGPQWHAEYITVSGKTLLVVIVEPPQPGDPIHPVRHQLAQYPKGRILIRRAAMTLEANDAEIDELVQRARVQAQRIDVALCAQPPAIQRQPPDWRAQIERMTEQARSLAEARGHPKLRATPGSHLDACVGQFSQLQALAAVTSAASLQQPDKRTEENYRSEVAAYAKRYSRCLWGRYAVRLRGHDPAQLHLVLKNSTERNFIAVAVQVHVAGDVTSWSEDLLNDLPHDEPALPQPPRQLGTPRPLFDGYPWLSPYIRPAVPFVSASMPGCGYTAENTGSFMLIFDPVDLRPGEELALPSVPLLVDAEPGTTLQCTWNATASNVDGQLTGSLTIMVEDSDVSLNDLNAE